MTAATPRILSTTKFELIPAFFMPDSRKAAERSKPGCVCTLEGDGRSVRWPIVPPGHWAGPQWQWLWVTTGCPVHDPPAEAIVADLRKMAERLRTA